MVTAVAEAHRLHPDRAIVLQNLDDVLFWGAVNQQCFRYLGIDNVYLAPGSESHITPHPELGDIAAYVMPVGAVRKNLDDSHLSVYAWRSGRLEDVTAGYQPPD